MDIQEKITKIISVQMYNFSRHKTLIDKNSTAGKSTW